MEQTKVLPTGRVLPKAGIIRTELQFKYKQISIEELPPGAIGEPPYMRLVWFTQSGARPRVWVQTGAMDSLPRSF